MYKVQKTKICVSIRGRKRSHIIKAPNIKWFNNKRIIHRHFLMSTNITNSLTFITRQDKLTGIFKKSRPIKTGLQYLMCSSISNVVSSISLRVTLVKDLFLFMLRYTTSNNTIYSLLIEVWVIPEVMS